MGTSPPGEKNETTQKPFAMDAHANHHMIGCQLDFSGVLANTGMTVRPITPPGALNPPTL
jgi:hypothetical protein